MKEIHVEPELTQFQVRDAAACLERLTHLAFFAGLMRTGVLFSQIRLQLVRIEVGVPLDEFTWLCLTDLFTEKWVNRRKHMEIEVRLRHSTKPESKIAAHADIVLSVTNGKIKINSFCIFRANGKPAWIAPPATKGTKRFFPLIVLSGEIRKQVEEAILAEFDGQAASAS